MPFGVVWVAFSEEVTWGVEMNEEEEAATW